MNGDDDLRDTGREPSMKGDPDLRNTGREPILSSRPERDMLGDGDRIAASRRDTGENVSGPDLDGAEAATVVLGRVGTWDEANAIRAALEADGFGTQDVEVFYTGPAGRHALTPIGGDAYADAGATRAGTGAATGGLAGAAAGLAVGAALATAPVTGPLLLTGAAVGAFGGALAGGVAATKDGSTQPDTPEHPVAKPAGVVVAVRTDRLEHGESLAARRLADGGALALERSPARWRDGAWVDWDPVANRDQLSPQPGTPQAGTQHGSPQG
ncbi:MAG TPA: hypothetical protein VEA81_01385 [Burkholderiaceae bacterium]|nr:hypothetical protein [Burkholderiaceae bacterium]